MADTSRRRLPGDTSLAMAQLAMNLHRLSSFELEPGTKAGFRIRLAGPQLYVPILQKVFPTPASWFGPYDSFDKRFDRVLYVQGADADPLKAFLTFLTQTLLVETMLDETWALDMHMTDGGDRTTIGESVYRAKTYSGKPGDRETAADLALLMANRVVTHPEVKRADLIVPVPANPPRLPHNLPDVLASQISRVAGRPLAQDVLIKTRPTNVKNLPNEEKIAALAGAYQVTTRIEAQTVVLVDDLLYSGSTLSQIGGLLRKAGASYIIGVVATKTLGS
jgi:Phosphoribosyl transferase domain